MMNRAIFEMSSRNLMLGFCGMLGSGKTAACAYIAEKFGGKKFRYSTPMAEMLDKLGLAQTRRNLQDMGTGMRKTFGEDVWGIAMRRQIEQTRESLIVIDGIRRFGDLTPLQSLSGFYLIFMDADTEMRFERQKDRTRDVSKTLEQFRLDEQHEAEKQIQDIGKTADHVIRNNGTLEEFYQQLDHLLHELRDSQN